MRLRESFKAKPRRLRLPMPGLVFVCLPSGCPQGRAPYVFAAPARPRSIDDQLYHAGRLWEEIAGAETFPVEDLVPQLHVGEALRIGG